MSIPKEWQCTLTWLDPTFVHPPINEPILVIVGSSVDRGRGFQPHYAVETIKVLAEDPDGDDDAYAFDAKWDDMQLKCVTTDLDDERDYYSDSIKWWSHVPAIKDQETRP